MHRYPYVGLLYAPGGRATAGTATLVAPDRVITAAHVLYDEQGELRRPLSSLRFRLGADFAREPYAERTLARVVASGHQKGYDPQNEHLDWVVLDLAEDAGSGAAVEAAPLLAAGARIDWSESQRVELVAYHRDVAGGGVRVASRCRTLIAADLLEPGEKARAVLELPGVLAHDCDATGLSSGAGLFVQRDGHPELAAIHIGSLGPEHASAPDLVRAHFNVAIELDEPMRAAIARH